MWKNRFFLFHTRCTVDKNQNLFVFLFKSVYIICIRVLLFSKKIIWSFLNTNFLKDTHKLSNENPIAKT